MAAGAFEQEMLRQTHCQTVSGDYWVRGGGHLCEWNKIRAIVVGFVLWTRFQCVLSYWNVLFERLRPSYRLLFLVQRGFFSCLFQLEIQLEIQCEIQGVSVVYSPSK